jgi:hypothetical protein
VYVTVSPGSVRIPSSKTVDGTKAAAQTVFDRFSGGDVAGAWAL